jgi:hypothetical protein
MDNYPNMAHVVEIAKIKEEYELKLAQLQHDLDEMRKLYHKAELRLDNQAKSISSYMRESLEIKQLNLQLMKLYYNEATGKDIEED